MAYDGVMDVSSIALDVCDVALDCVCTVQLRVQLRVRRLCARCDVFRFDPLAQPAHLLRYLSKVDHDLVIVCLTM